MHCGCSNGMCGAKAHYVAGGNDNKARQMVRNGKFATIKAAKRAMDTCRRNPMRNINTDFVKATGEVKQSVKKGKKNKKASYFSMKKKY